MKSLGNTLHSITIKDFILDISTYMPKYKEIYVKIDLSTDMNSIFKELNRKSKEKYCNNNWYSYSMGSDYGIGIQFAYKNGIIEGKIRTKVNYLEDMYITHTFNNKKEDISLYRLYELGKLNSVILNNKTKLIKLGDYSNLKDFNIIEDADEHICININLEINMKTLRIVYH